jgi:predicted nucleic acid-binding protein
MTVLVMDSSSALKWALPEPFSDKAEKLREDFQNALIELIAPDIFSIETVHA